MSKRRDRAGVGAGAGVGAEVETGRWAKDPNLCALQREKTKQPAVRTAVDCKPRFVSPASQPASQSGSQLTGQLVGSLALSLIPAAMASVRFE